MTVRAHAIVAVPHAGWYEPAAFVALTFTAGWGLVLLGASAPVVALAMWAPGLVAIALTRAAGAPAIAGLRLDRLGWADAYLVALWLPFVFSAGTTALTAALGLGRLDEAVGGDTLIGSFVTALTVGPLVNLAVTLGPELGWRAFFLRRLLPLGEWNAILLTSVLWTAWQAPLGVGGTSLTADARGAVQLAWCVAIGAILGWLYVRTRSPWAPALFAAALGSTASLDEVVLRDVLPTFAGPIGPVALVLPLLAVLALLSVPLRSAEA